jgi:hypothetical protein
MIDKSDDLWHDLRSTDPTMKQREMTAGIDQQMAASLTGDRSAQRVSRLCLTRRSYIVFGSFHGHERGRTDRIEINLVAGKNANCAERGLVRGKCSEYFPGQVPLEDPSASM